MRGTRGGRRSCSDTLATRQDAYAGFAGCETPMIEVGELTKRFATKMAVDHLSFDEPDNNVGSWRLAITH